jgi:AraC-like DNA-binding protein
VWHYHPELELHYVLKGEGVRFIGDSVRNFSSGEMILMGENLPHTWRCHEKYFEENSCCHVEAVVLQFLPTCLGRDFLLLPEAFLIPRLFEKAKRGLIIGGEKKSRVAHLLSRALKASDVDRLILLLSILKVLATGVDDDETITSTYTFNQSNATEMARLDKIYSYALANYKKEISLGSIASIANMSETSFCRYFKLMTNKTFSEFLTEIRISHVCRALVENKLPTEVICFESGFNNISNFYRHFKRVTDLTPYEYKTKYLSNEMPAKNQSLILTQPLSPRSGIRSS